MCSGREKIIGWEKGAAKERNGEKGGGMLARRRVARIVGKMREGVVRVRSEQERKHA